MRRMNESSVPADSYADIAELYDLEHGDFDEDLPFYLNMCLLVGGPVLELASGSGRIMRPLLDAGFKVTGLDSSPVMLDRARAALSSKKQRANLTLVELPMTSADQAPGGPFGVVILGLNGLLHATKSSEQRQILAAARSALRPGGQLLLDVVNPATPLFHGLDQQVLHEGRWTDDRGNQIDKFSSRVVAPAEQLIDVSLWYDIIDAHGGLRRVRTGLIQRYVQRAELELMLELAGFESWTVHGGYELEPFDDSSDRIVVAAVA